jgi:GNAT superfamily N-acetyltransferase
MPPRFEITESPERADHDAIIDGLVAFNESKAGKTEWVPVVIRLRDETGKVVGGIAARTGFDWLHIELLFVPEALRGRGLGAGLMRQAEAYARERGFTGIWLDTFEFQARPFYEKLGYSIFGTIEDYPPGGRRYFLQKRLRA